MENKLLEATRKRDEIMHSQGVYCPKCSQKQFAPFDKLYTFAYGECYMCDASSDDELTRKSENIFTIIEC